MLSESDLFTWRSDLLAAAVSASETLPSPVTMTPDLRPSRCGLYLFGEMLQIPSLGKAISGVGWRDLGGGFTAYFIYRRTDGTTHINWGPHICEANFVFSDGADIDLESARGLDVRVFSAQEYDAKSVVPLVLKLLISSWIWIKQRIFVVSSGATSHHSRKIAARAGTGTSVSVIILRRKADTGLNPDDGRSGLVEWTCQWLVRGHWRQQFYPSRMEHRPLWIEPYTKGPEDKPFKSPADVVFAVVR
jgi:hypothetical protein